MLEIIQRPKESLIDLAAAALLVVSSCSANKLAIAASGAIPILVGSLNSQLAEERGFQNLSVQAKLDIISTFHKLSTYPPIIPSIVSSGMVKAMLQLMYEFGKQSKIIEKAMALLEKMVSSSEIALEEVAETAPLVIHFLVEAVEEGTPLCKEHAAATLLVMCQSCRDRCKSKDWLKNFGVAKRQREEGEECWFSSVSTIFVPLKKDSIRFNPCFVGLQLGLTPISSFPINCP